MIEIKYVIGLLGAHSSWSYFKEKSNAIFDNFCDNYFVGGTPENAKKFDFYHEALARIEYLGPGIFKVQEIIIHKNTL